MTTTMEFQNRPFLCVWFIYQFRFYQRKFKNRLYFFWTSACSIDTGIVVSVYLRAAVDRDLFNVSTGKTSFYYYNQGTKDIFITLPPLQVTVTVTSFIYATGIATGTVSGKVFTAKGGTACITDGRFKAELH
jgi:hypothetical protein